MPSGEFFAPAKINLFLEVHPPVPGERLHRVETVLEKISLFDRLEIETAPSGVRVECRPEIVPPEQNLAFRAASVLKERFGVRRGARILLEKNIPVGAGLGGGSSDAAAVLICLNSLWRIDLDWTGLIPAALELGSDVPSFLCPGRCLAEGFGEKVTPLATGRKYQFDLFLTGLPVATGNAYRALDCLTYRPLSGKMMLESLREGTPDAVGSNLFNRFEQVLPRLAPGLAQWHESLGRNYRFPLLAGSGGSFFALETDERRETRPKAPTGRPGALRVNTVGGEEK